MALIPTVTIKADNAKGRKIINAEDFDPKLHERFEEAPAPVDEGGKDGDPDPVEIPEDWREFHWKSQAKLAKDISGEPAGNAEAAIAVIEEELARRAEAQE